jgi:hypothetical protein
LRRRDRGADRTSLRSTLPSLMGTPPSGENSVRAVFLHLREGDGVRSGDGGSGGALHFGVCLASSAATCRATSAGISLRSMDMIWAALPRLSTLLSPEPVLGSSSDAYSFSGGDKASRFRPRRSVARTPTLGRRRPMTILAHGRAEWVRALGPRVVALCVAREGRVRCVRQAEGELAAFDTNCNTCVGYREEQDWQSHPSYSPAAEQSEAVQHTVPPGVAVP